MTALALAALVAGLACGADRKPISGVCHAEEVKDGPKLTASGLAWWKDRLIIADRVPKKLRAFTPPDSFADF